MTATMTLMQPHCYSFYKHKYVNYAVVFLAIFIKVSIQIWQLTSKHENCLPGRKNWFWSQVYSMREKEMATRSSVLAWRITGTGEPGGLLSMGPHRVRHYWSDLAAAAAAAYSMSILTLWDFLWQILFFNKYLSHSCFYFEIVLLFCLACFFGEWFSAVSNFGLQRSSSNIWRHHNMAARGEMLLESNQ